MGSLDCVIVHKQKRSDEVLWAIKSIQKNLTHRNIYVIGDPVEIDGVINVPHEPQAWASLSKYHDVISKYFQACNIKELSDDFISINDDTYCMTDWQPLNYNRGSLREHYSQRGLIYDSYSKSLMRTERYLQQRELPTLSFELHTPFLYNKAKLKELILSINNIHLAWQIRSLYGNTYQCPTEPADDVKSPANPEGMPIISTNEPAFMGKLGDYIREQLS